MIESELAKLHNESSDAFAVMKNIRSEIVTIRGEMRLPVNSDERRSELQQECVRLESEWDDAFCKYNSAQSRFTRYVYDLVRSR